MFKSTPLRILDHFRHSDQLFQPLRIRIHQSQSAVLQMGRVHHLPDRLTPKKQASSTYHYHLGERVCAIVFRHENPSFAV